MNVIIAAGIAIEVWALLAAAPARAADPVEDQGGALEEVREAGPQTAPVELDGEVLFWVVGAKSFPAADRARATRENIVALARDPAVDMHRNILDVFNEYGVQIMTPAYEGDPAEPKVVPKERWYALPAEGRAEGGATPGESLGADRPKGDDRH